MSFEAFFATLVEDQYFLLETNWHPYTYNKIFQNVSSYLDYERKYDGYYCILNSELDMPSQRVIEIYRGLSDIEDSFKVSKSDLDIRAVNVSRKD